MKLSDLQNYLIEDESGGTTFTVTPDLIMRIIKYLGHKPTSKDRENVVAFMRAHPDLFRPSPPPMTEHIDWQKVKQFALKIGKDAVYVIGIAGIFICLIALGWIAAKEEDFNVVLRVMQQLNPEVFGSLSLARPSYWASLINDLMDKGDWITASGIKSGLELSAKIGGNAY